jgi:UbiD family decarboxylase
VKSLHTHLDRLREIGMPPIEIEQQMDCRTHDLAALAKRLEDMGNRRPLLFKNTLNQLGEPSQFPLLMNLFATRALCAAALEHPVEDYGMGLTHKYAELVSKYGETVVIPKGDAPVKECVCAESEIDCRKFPIPYCHENDVGPYFVMSNIMKSHEGFYDATMTKNLIYGPKRLSVSAHWHHHLMRIYEEYEQRNERAPIAIVVSHHPAFFLGMCALADWANDDYGTLASCFQEPFRLTASETWGDKFLVPADAELIIEGEVIPHERATQNPFGEISGHYQEVMNVPVVEVTAVTHRNNAIFQHMLPGRPEHWILGGLPKEGTVWADLKPKIPSIQALHLPDSGCGRFSLTMSFKDPKPADFRIASLMCFADMPNLKIAIGVDDDINVFDEREVQWAVATQTWWDKDIETIQGVQSFRKWLGDTVVMIDARRPAIPDFPERNRMPEEALSRVESLARELMSR